MHVAGGPHDVRISQHVMRGASLIADVELHGVNFPHDPAVANTAATADQVNKLPGLCHAAIVQREAIGDGNCAFGSPLAANLASLRVVPAAALGSIVNISDVVLVLLGAQNGKETIVIAADAS